ncbi:MAG: fibronectin type III domain-containing protein [Candidatus Zapsychrus exili]|nr:fibronectin type III domain-containing protein [Candidatus Zapsychrus exili]
MRKSYFKILCTIAFVAIVLTIAPSIASAVPTNFSVAVVDGLRTNINNKRNECGLPNQSWTNENLYSNLTPIKAAHIDELRGAIKEVYALSPLNITKAFVDPNITFIRELHIDEIQAALNEVTCCGDGTCDAVEDNINCAADCGCPNICTGGSGGCGGLDEDQCGRISGCRWTGPIGGGEWCQLSSQQAPNDGDWNCSDFDRESECDLFSTEGCEWMQPEPPCTGGGEVYCGNGICDGEENETNCFEDCGEVPGIPKNLSAEAGDGRWVDLAWQVPNPSPTIINRYFLDRSESPTFSPAGMSTPTTNLTVRDENIDFQTTYYYRVRAEEETSPGEFNSSEWSNVVSATACIEGLLWDGNSCEPICEYECVGYVDEGSCPNCNPPFTVPDEDSYGCNGPCGCDCRPVSGYSMLCSDYSVKNCPTSDGCSLDCAGSATVSCGDGLGEVPEECDNGSSNGVACEAAYDETCEYCSQSCTIIEVIGPYCGDGNVDTPFEACDNGGSNSDVCPAKPPKGNIKVCTNACLFLSTCGGEGDEGSIELCGNGICDAEENSELCPEDCSAGTITCHKDGECNDGNECTAGDCINSGTTLSYCVHNPTPGERCRTYNSRGQTIWGECTYDGNCVSVRR